MTQNVIVNGTMSVNVTVFPGKEQSRVMGKVFSNYAHINSKLHYKRSFESEDSGVQNTQHFGVRSMCVTQFQKLRWCVSQWWRSPCFSAADHFQLPK